MKHWFTFSETKAICSSQLPSDMSIYIRMVCTDVENMVDMGSVSVRAMYLLHVHP